MFRRVLAMASTAILLMAPSISSGTAAGGAPAPRNHDPHLVRLLGRETFEANTMISATFRFSPERMFPHTGERVAWLDQDHVPDPHTVTVVRKSQLPTSLAEAFNCDACNDALDKHFGAGPPVTRVNVGLPGLDQPGDSLLLFDGERIGAMISAPSGTHLFYLCSIHPWMQGKLRVG